MNEMTEPAMIRPLADQPVRRLQLPRLEAYREYVPDAKLLARTGIVGFDGRDTRSRPFKLMRTQFAKKVAHADVRLIGITSAAPDAGKSFVALNLAAALSRVADQSVYLVDFDLRRGSIADELGMTPDVGLSDYLNGTTDDAGATGMRVAGTRLVVFPTRRQGDHTAELLASDRAADLVTALRNNPDGATVLFDLPPVFANDDTMIAVEMLDAYLMIVESGVTTRRQVIEAMGLLAPKPCIGSVLNRYKGGLFDDYGYAYGYGSYSKYDN